jgi:putative transposase
VTGCLSALKGRYRKAQGIALGRLAAPKFSALKGRYRKAQGNGPKICLVPNRDGFHSAHRQDLREAPLVAQSLSSILIHLIFSTKHREPLITAKVELALHAYMAGILRQKQCPALTIGGMPDHVHVLFLLARTRSVSEVVEDLKKDSSKWIKTLGPPFREFYWQAGYGAFSIGQSSVEEARRYIDVQKEHHKIRTFQDEYRAFLRKYGVEYDERYVWD